MNGSSPPLPDFLIVGASKAGTTSLFRLLASSDAVYMPEKKELNFFSVATCSMSINEISLDRYKKHFEQAPTGTLKGEASPSYLWFPGVAEKIKHFLPAARIVMILRNPVDRFWSDYQYAVLWGHHKHDLPEFLSGDHAENIAWHSPYALIQKGRYANQVATYLDAFGREKVFIALFEDFVASPIEVAQSVMKFVGTEARIDESNSWHNVGRIVRSRHLASARCLVATNRLFMRLPLSWRTFLDDIYLAVNAKPGKVQIPGPIATQLRDIYADDISELSALLGRDLSPWLAPKTASGPSAANGT